MKTMVTLSIPNLGDIPIQLEPQRLAPKAAAAITSAAAAGTRARLHRAEPLPAPNSMGPPYALVQFSISDDGKLARLPHEHSAPIKRGDVCLIGGASDLFISLARNGEHDGWESGMTVLGTVPEPALSELVEDKILALPKHNFTHPNYGTVMSMLDKELPGVLQLR